MSRTLFLLLIGLAIAWLAGCVGSEGRRVLHEPAVMDATTQVDDRRLCNELMRVTLAEQLFTSVTPEPVAKPSGGTLKLIVADGRHASAKNRLEWSSPRMLLADPHQHDAVGGHVGVKSVCKRAEVLLPPQVADRPAAFDRQVGPVSCDLGLDRPTVEQSDRF